MLLGAAFAQSNQVQNAWNYIRSKELDKAKASIDLAAQNDATKNSPKMWLYRAQTYFNILQSKEEKFKNLDPEAAEKAFTAVINCYKADKDKIFYDDVKVLLVPTSFYLYNKIIADQGAKNYERAMQNLKTLFEAIPYDKDDALKHQDISNDKLMYLMYVLGMQSKNTSVSKEYITKLIGIKYKDPNIYRDIASIYLTEKDTAKALAYIEQGRALFEDNQDLIIDQTSIYISQNKSDVLLSKIEDDLKTSPDNEMLYFNQGYLFQRKNNLDKAEVSFKKAVELKPDFIEACHSLGALYLNRGIDCMNKADGLSANEGKKIDELTKNGQNYFAMAIPYLEKVHLHNPKDKKISNNLLQLYAKTGNEEKYKQLNDELKAGK